MPGVVFLIVVPTANFERELIRDSHYYDLSLDEKHAMSSGGDGIGLNDHVNIHMPKNNKGILRLEVELRDKNAQKNRYDLQFGYPSGASRQHVIRGNDKHSLLQLPHEKLAGNGIVPLEKVLEELLAKLKIEHVTWMTSKKGYFHQVVFPLQAGDPCETTLHCLTQLGIGTKLNSSVSVMPCSVSYDALTTKVENSVDSLEGDDLTKWNNFIDSIKSKLTVKQVVDGVRAGGSLSFDYILLIVTADSLAALGLVENNAPNITAAMLVSPLMGPVMSITFGAIISDRELLRVGFISLAVGMFLSCLFGFIFGLILGTTEMPWGSGDWPTEEMRGRGNVRSLWMGVLWALTSGTGVAVALLQGSAGPLIGVAISASLLPPVVNCGLFWALACIWLIYPGIRIPHLKGEGYNETSAYPFLYTDYLPTEFLINGIVSCLLTVVNVICIFITAILVLKIKEVSAPYTASPDLKRFWETDLRTVRKTNRSTIRRYTASGRGDAVENPVSGIESTLREKLLRIYPEMDEKKCGELDNVLEQAFKEAQDDITFKKVKHMSYSSNAAGELSHHLAKLTGMHKPNESDIRDNVSHDYAESRMNSVRTSKTKIDLKALDKLITNLLEQLSTNSLENKSKNNKYNSAATSSMRKTSLKLNGWRSTSRSGHSRSFKSYNKDGVTNYVALLENGNNAAGLAKTIVESPTGEIAGEHMPTIMESSVGGSSNNVNEVTNTNNRNCNDYISNNMNRESNTRTHIGADVTTTNSSDSTVEGLNLTQNFIS